MEPVFSALEIAGRTAVRGTGTRINYLGLEHIPSAGAAVVAINHTGYVDFLPAALAAMYRRRRMRFMVKAEVQDVKIVNFLIARSGVIPVAVERVRADELIGTMSDLRTAMSALLHETHDRSGCR